MATIDNPLKYFRISDLPGIPGPLPPDSLAMVELSLNGTSKKCFVWSLFGENWRKELAAPAADYSAPNSDHADQCDYATLAADAEKVNGLSLSAPTMTRISRIIAAGETWTIPAGMWQLARNSIEADDDALVVEVADDSGFWLGRMALGLIVTDGGQVRIRNTSTESRYVLGHRLA